MVTHKKTVSFKANKNDVAEWKDAAKKGSMTLSSFILKKMEKEDTGFDQNSKEWKDLIKYYKELHAGLSDSVMGKVTGAVIGNRERSVKDSEDICLGITFGQLKSLNNFLSTFFSFALLSEDN